MRQWKNVVKLCTLLRLKYQCSALCGLASCSPVSITSLTIWGKSRFNYHFMDGKIKTYFCEKKHLKSFPFEIERYPFDWQTPFGYSIAFLSQYALSFYIFYAAITLTGFVIGSYRFLILLSNDIANDFAKMKRIRGNDWTFFNKFSGLIQLHSNAKQLNRMFNFI